MRREAMVAAAVALLPLCATGTAMAAGTTNPRASCVAQTNAVLGPPGPEIEFIKMYNDPAPGRYLSAIARSSRSSCPEH